ncbi:MAG: FAD binding domain-containing protein [Nocardioides sp.]|uniref:FAD binding domain-containing protein n=1 Tax=Nocardioides sp. TaxID=35761 RepID=UPI0039E569F6
MDLAWVETWRRPRERGGLTLAPGERVVAGGTWLFSEPQPSVTGLVDLTGLGWDPFVATPGGGVSIAATCTIEHLVDSPWPAHLAALVRQCADALLMSFKIQQAATVGGNVCMALPAGAMISLLTALDAEAVVWAPDGSERREPVASFVQGVLATSLAPGEVVRSFDVSAEALADRYAFGRISLTTYGRSAAVVIARRTPSGIRLAITGSVPAPVVLELCAEPGREEVAAAIAEITHWYDDVHGAADWRAAQTLRLAQETVAEVLR